MDVRGREGVYGCERERGCVWMCMDVRGNGVGPGEGADAAAGHVEEGGGGGARVQRRLDAPQEVVGLEQQQHLPRYPVEQLADLGQVERHVAAHLHFLTHTHTHTHTSLDFFCEFSFTDRSIEQSL